MAAIAPLIVILGPTASGKTAAAIELAQKIDGEIICADSRTVYRGMDVGTAKPSQEEQKRVPHHLIDVVNPDEVFSVAEFKARAIQEIEKIWARKRIPLMVGGTGLYIDSVIYDYQFGGQADERLRIKLEQMGLDNIVDYATTHKIDLTGINVKNRRHLVRAVERGGVVIQPKRLRGSTIVLGMEVEKSVLQQRIDERVEKMFADGFLDEVKGLAEAYGWENESMSGIGYRVAKEYFEGLSTIEEVKIAFKQRDRSLAKRQMTWFKRSHDIVWCKSAEELMAKASEFIAGYRV